VSRLKILDLKLRNALADIHLVSAGFFGLCIVRFLNCQTIGLQFDTVTTAVDTHGLYKSYVENTPDVEYDYNDDGSLTEIPVELKSESELMAELLEEFVFSTLEEALAFLGTHTKETIGDPATQLTDAEKSVFLYPDQITIKDTK